MRKGRVVVETERIAAVAADTVSLSQRVPQIVAEHSASKGTSEAAIISHMVIGLDDDGYRHYFPPNP